MQNTTQLLVSGSDPLLMLIRMENYKKVLGKYFSNFFISVGFGIRERSDEEKNQIKDYFEYLRDGNDNIKFIYPEEDSQNHGCMIEYLVKTFYDDLDDNVFFIEDDDFIINPHLFELHLNSLNYNGYDFVGESRGCCDNQKLMDLEVKILKEDDVYINSSEDCSGQESYHYWPTHFLTKKKFLKKDDIFRAFDWKRGEEIDLRGRKFKFNKHSCGDTFVKFSIDLLNRVDKGYEFKPFGCNLNLFDNLFNYFFQLGLIHDSDFFSKLNVKDAQKLVSRQFQYHLGSGSCVNRFCIKDLDIMTEDVFEQIDLLYKRKDYASLVDIYRRYHIYKIAFKVLQDNVRLDSFKEGYIQNFKVADEYFQKLDINKLISDLNINFMLDAYYIETFKQIVGI